jgi:hypothetical protein
VHLYVAVTSPPLRRHLAVTSPAEPAAQGANLSDTDAAEQIQLDAIAAEALDLLGTAPTATTRLTHSRVTRGVWRVNAGERTSAVVKVLVPPPPGDAYASEPASMRYWLREALLYGAGTPEPYVEAGVRGPALLARFDRRDGDVALWLEDVRGAPAADWGMAGFARAAIRLGRAQGAYLASAPLPDDEWLSRGFLRQYLAARNPADDELLASDEAWSRPVIARHFSATLRDGLRRLRADRESLLGWLEAAPCTFAHLDVWPDNMFEPPGELVLIDWGFAGMGSVGEDIGNLVPDSIFDLRHPPSMLPDLDRTLFEGYLAGLRDAGWAGDERLVRLAMCASACKYDWIAGAALSRAGAASTSGADNGSAQAGTSSGSVTQPIYGGIEVEADRFFEVRAAVLAYLVDRAAEARALARTLELA